MIEINCCRRNFLKGSLALGAASIFQNFFDGAFAAENPANDKTFVAIYMPGGYDGLSFLPPYGDPYYYSLRPNIAVPQSSIKTISNSSIFGFSPDLQELKDIYESGDMAIFTTVDLDKPTRSHFYNQNYIFSQLNSVDQTKGWLNEALRTNSDKFDNGLKLFSMEAATPHMVRGTFPVSFGSSANAIKSTSVTRAAALRSIYNLFAPEKSFSSIISSNFNTYINDADLLSSFNPSSYSPSNGAVYHTRYGLDTKLKTAAYLIKNARPNAIYMNYPIGFDTHQNQVSSLQSNLPHLSKNLYAFYKDLGPLMEKVCVLVFSEFGRTVKENGTLGTDHGNANIWFSIGKNLNGGIYGTWSGLNPSNLASGNFIRRSINAGDVFSEILTKHLSLPDISNIFSNYSYNTNIGFIKA